MSPVVAHLGQLGAGNERQLSTRDETPAIHAPSRESGFVHGAWTGVAASRSERPLRVEPSRSGARARGSGIGAFRAMANPSRNGSVGWKCVIPDLSGPVR